MVSGAQAVHGVLQQRQQQLLWSQILQGLELGARVCGFFGEIKTKYLGCRPWPLPQMPQLGSMHSQAGCHPCLAHQLSR